VLTASAQEKKEESLKGSHQVTLGLGHTYLSARIEDQTKWLGVVSWSFDYAYWFRDRWAVGLQTDLLNESFKVETDKGEVLERENPVIVLPAAIYRASEHIHLVGGAGSEFSKGEHLFITRVGMEYVYPLPKRWEVGASLVWDAKWNYYHSFGISLAISRSWAK
jgi:hypothetical protein